jgi:hypothetical protein
VKIAVDDFVFVADSNNNRVVLMPGLDFHAFIGASQPSSSGGVCADNDVVVASERMAGCVSVFIRCDGARVRGGPAARWCGSLEAVASPALRYTTTRSVRCVRPTCIVFTG